MSQKALITGLFSFVLVCNLLTACKPPNSTPIDLTSELGRETGAAGSFGGIQRAFLAPGGDYSMVTMRTRPDLANENAVHNILCSAPSPDWSTALSMAQQLQGSGSVTGGPSAALSASNSLTETITALAGRSAGVVALRDGLYKACEAYANGVIGKDAYALILSQYGNLLTSMAGSGGVGGASTASPATTTPAGVAVAVTNAAVPAAPTTSSQAAGAGGGNTQVQLMQQQVLGALIVSCINDGDRTVRTESERNQTLTAAGVCDTFMKNVVQKLPALLDQMGSGSGVTTKPALIADPKVTALQNALVQCGAKLAVDGVMGPKTEAAKKQFPDCKTKPTAT